MENGYTFRKRMDGKLSRIIPGWVGLRYHKSLTWRWHQCRSDLCLLGLTTEICTALTTNHNNTIIFNLKYGRLSRPRETKGYNGCMRLIDRGLGHGLNCIKLDNILNQKDRVVWILSFFSTFLSELCWRMRIRDEKGKVSRGLFGNSGRTITFWLLSVVFWVKRLQN